MNIKEFRKKVKELGHDPGDFSDCYGYLNNTGTKTTCKKCGAELWLSLYEGGSSHKEVMKINKQLIKTILRCEEVIIKEIIE